MKCPECGTENDELALHCVKCEAKLDYDPGVPKPPPAPRQVEQTATPQAPPPDPNHPAAGLVDAPPEGRVPPAPQKATGPTSSQPYQPLSNFQPGYGYAPPADGNTSGYGSIYPPPPFATGWTFAGLIPFGLFAFLNQSTIWGVIGVLGHFIPLGSLVYLIYIGIEGRKIAWQSRRFNSRMEFEDTMSAWNRWGLVVMFIYLGLILLVLLFYVFAFALLFGTIFALGS